MLFGQTALPNPVVAAPLLTIEHFINNAKTLGETNQVRLRGVVTHVISDRTYFVQEGEFGVYVFHKPDVAFHPGEWVEVTGYASLGGLVPTLQKCTAELLGLGKMPAPQSITGKDLLSRRYAMKLVRIEGRLIDRDLAGGRLLLFRTREGDQSFQVNLEAIDNSALLARPEPGSVLGVLGVLVVHQGADGQADNSSILVRTPADLQVIEGPPFWTLRRVGQALAGVAVVLILALVWVMLLRQQVRAQTKLVEERFEREAALRALEDRFAKVFRATPDALVITRASDDTILEVNPAYETLCGRTSTELVGQREANLKIWSDPAEWAAALKILHTSGSLRNFECVLVSAEGTPVHCLYAAESIELRGERCRLGVLRDVTEQKQLEDERLALQNQLERTQRIQSLGTLAGGIAHDFNNLLAAILGNADLARQSASLSGEIKLSLEEIRKAAMRGRDLVDRILSFSRSNPQLRSAIHLGPVVAEAAGLLRATMPSAITLETDLDSGTPVVMADVTQIHQIVMNLGTNASQAIGHKQGKILIKVAPVTLDLTGCAAFPDLRPGLYATLVVSDSGAGMSASVQERIFEPFFTTKSPGKGTGLGLAAVHGFVKNHGGAIKVESRPGEGSTFTIFLPATESRLEASAPAPPPALTPVSSPSSREILVIDDEDLVASVVSRVLKKLGHRVTATTNPLEAITLFEQDVSRFSLVFTDLNMPGMTGLEVAKRVRALRSDVPIILASGNIAAEVSARAVAAGANRIVHKPITMAELTEAVQGELRMEISSPPS